MERFIYKKNIEKQTKLHIHLINKNSNYILFISLRNFLSMNNETNEFIIF